MEMTGLASVAAAGGGTGHGKDVCPIPGFFFERFLPFDYRKIRQKLSSWVFHSVLRRKN